MYRSHPQWVWPSFHGEELEVQNQVEGWQQQVTHFVGKRCGAWTRSLWSDSGLLNDGGEGGSGGSAVMKTYFSRESLDPTPQKEMQSLKSAGGNFSLEKLCCDQKKSDHVQNSSDYVHGDGCRRNIGANDDQSG